MTNGLKQPEKCFFYAAFYGRRGHLGTPKSTEKGPQVVGMYGPISKAENKPLTKSLGPLF
jgi:hypothetical protein